MPITETCLNAATFMSKEIGCHACNGACRSAVLGVLPIAEWQGAAVEYRFSQKNKKRGAQTEILGCRDSFIVESRRIKVRLPVRTSGGCTACCGLSCSCRCLRQSIHISLIRIGSWYVGDSLYFTSSALHRSAAGATLCARFGRHCGDGSLSESNIPPPVRRRGGHYQISFVIKANRLLCDIRPRTCLYELRRRYLRGAECVV